MVKQKKKEKDPRPSGGTIDATQHDNNGDEKVEKGKVNKPTEPIAPNHIRVRPGV